MERLLTKIEAQETERSITVTPEMFPWIDNEGEITLRAIPNEGIWIGSIIDFCPKIKSVKLGLGKDETKIIKDSFPIVAKIMLQKPENLARIKKTCVYYDARALNTRLFVVKIGQETVIEVAASTKKTEHLVFSAITGATGRSGRLMARAN